MITKKHCACGCGTQLPPPTKRNPRTTHRFLYGHQTRSEAFRVAKAASRVKPPDDWAAPNGLCECGCGERTPIAKSTRRNTDGSFRQIIGYPGRFVMNHHVRVQPTGALHPKWTGGRHELDGYVMIYTPGSKHRYEAEHRLVWARKHGPIPPFHTIHHKNGIRNDNRLGNLECLTRAAHKLLHAHGDLPTHNHHQSDEQMIAAAVKVARRLRRPLRIVDLCKKNGTPHHRTYLRRWSSAQVLEMVHAAISKS